ncbi:MAG: hypothetical protein D3910_20150, partial [Candidatus Electrothrix sp. ATG2]|nr:hypothetical protein [Candidatus Electrothrix sp. ATG2]
TKEPELQSVRWVENPNHVIELIRDHLLAPGDDKKHKEFSPDEHNYLRNKIKRRLERYAFERPFRPRWYILLLLSSITRRLFRLSENSCLYHLMEMSAMRKKLLCLEEKFLAQGDLKCKGDIFFLRLQEIMHMQQGFLGWPDVEERIHQRRHKLIIATRKIPAKTVGINQQDNRTKNQSASSGASRVTLPGQVASPGSCTGQARVIMNPAKNPELRPGEILVAPYTDPRWTPFFLTASGAVVEIGSYLSHAGIASREYTLPCIVDVSECTKRIQTGDLLWINGDKGEVQILKEARV